MPQPDATAIRERDEFLATMPSFLAVLQQHESRLPAICRELLDSSPEYAADDAVAEIDLTGMSAHPDQFSARLFTRHEAAEFLAWFAPAEADRIRTPPPAGSIWAILVFVKIVTVRPIQLQTVAAETCGA